MKRRLAGTLIAALVAAAVVATGADAFVVPMTGSQITSPVNPIYAFGEDSSTPDVTIQGTTTGAANGLLDLKCYSAGGTIATLKANVPFSGNAFSVSVTRADVSDMATGAPCALRAVPYGDTAARPITDTADPYVATQLSPSTLARSMTGGQISDYSLEAVGLDARMAINSAEAGITDSRLVDPATLTESPTLFWAAVGFNGGDLIKVDGTDSFLPDSISGSPGWQGLGVQVDSFDHATGTLTLHSVEPVLKETAGPYEASGVELVRTWVVDRQAHRATATDAWRSVDGHEHSVALKYGTSFQQDATDKGAMSFPGGSGFAVPSVGDQHTLPSGPGTIYVKFDSTTADAGDGQHPQGAMTYASAPDGPVRIDNTASGIDFTTPYNRTVPAGGETTLRFAFAIDYSLADVQASAETSRSDFVPTPPIAAPAAPAAPGAPADPQAPAPPGASFPGVSLLGRLLPSANGVSFGLACAAGPCSGVATLVTTEIVRSPGNKVTGLAKRRVKHKKVVLGRAAFSIASGAHRTVTVRLNASGRKLGKRFKRIPASLVVNLTGQHAPAFTRKVAIKAKKKRAH